MKSDSTDYPWQDLIAFSESQPFPSISLEPGIELSRPVPVKDRLALYFLDGKVPVAILALAGIILTRGSGDMRILLCSVAAVPLLAWGAAPLVRLYGIVNPLRVTALALPLLLLCTGLTLVPASVLHTLEGKPLHLEFGAQILQRSLENVFDWSFLAYLGVLLGTLHMTQRIRDTFTWLDLPREFRFSHQWRWTFVFLSLVSGFLFLLNQVWLTAEETAWLETQATAVHSRPFGSLPMNGSETTWERRSKELRARIERAAGNPDSSTRAQRKKALAGVELTLDYENDPPSSLREHRFALTYLGGIEDGEHNADEVMLNHLEFILVSRPIDPFHLTPMIENFLIYSFATGPQTPRNIERHRLSVQKLKALLQPPLVTLDQTAYWLLWVSPDSLQHGDPGVGWESHAPANVYGELDRSWFYRGSPTPTPLKLFGTESPWSPTNLAQFTVRRSLNRSWLQARTVLLSRPPEEYRAYCMSRADATTGTEQLFWTHLFEVSAVHQERAILETAEVVLLLRRHYAEVGSYPSDLTSILDQVKFQAAPGQRFQWNPETATLRDRLFNEYRLTNSESSP